MGAKTRGNYPTGGWCPVLKMCINAGKELCIKCIKMSEYESVEEGYEKFTKKKERLKD